MNKFFDAEGRGFEIYCHKYMDHVNMAIDDKSLKGGKRYISIKEEDIDDIIITLTDAKNKLNRFRREEKKPGPKIRVAFDEVDPMAGLSEQTYLKKFAYLEIHDTSGEGKVIKSLKVTYGFARELREGDEIKFRGDMFGGDNSEFKPSFILSDLDQIESLIGKSFMVRSRYFDLSSEGFAEENTLRIICEYYSKL